MKFASFFLTAIVLTCPNATFTPIVVWSTLSPGCTSPGYACHPVSFLPGWATQGLLATNAIWVTPQIVNNAMVNVPYNFTWNVVFPSGMSFCTLLLYADNSASLYIDGNLTATAYYGGPGAVNIYGITGAHTITITGSNSNGTVNTWASNPVGVAANITCQCPNQVPPPTTGMC